MAEKCCLAITFPGNVVSADNGFQPHRICFDMSFEGHKRTENLVEESEAQFSIG
jgi:hypothetical protein